VQHSALSPQNDLANAPKTNTNEAAEALPTPKSATISPAMSPEISAGANYTVLSPATSAPERRVALVIGNESYQSGISLLTPKNDADDMALKLSEIGFEVVKGVNLS
jgi:Caspase domain